MADAMQQDDEAMGAAQPIEWIYLETRGDEARDAEETTRKLAMMRLERLLEIDGALRKSATTSSSASMTVLPVTSTTSLEIPSRSKFASEAFVGGK